MFQQYFLEKGYLELELECITTTTNINYPSFKLKFGGYYAPNRKWSRRAEGAVAWELLRRQPSQ